MFLRTFWPGAEIIEALLLDLCFVAARCWRWSGMIILTTFYFNDLRPPGLRGLVGHRVVRNFEVHSNTSCSRRAGRIVLWSWKVPFSVTQCPCGGCDTSKSPDARPGSGQSLAEKRRAVTNWIAVVALSNVSCDQLSAMVRANQR